MSISPPSDIVLDVARAADPGRYRAAVERLTRLAPAGEAQFEDALDAVPGKLRPADNVARPKAMPPIPGPLIGGAAAKTYRAFEAMTLATFIEAAFPENSDAFFGAGAAGSMWKSVFAQQIASQMADAGGIGLAKQLSRSIGAAKADSPVLASNDPSSLVKATLVSTAERGFLKTVAAVESASATDPDP